MGNPTIVFTFVPIVSVLTINAPLPHLVHAKVCSVAEPFEYLILGLVIAFLPPRKVVRFLFFRARDLFFGCAMVE